MKSTDDEELCSPSLCNYNLLWSVSVAFTIALAAVAIVALRLRLQLHSLVEILGSSTPPGSKRPFFRISLRFQSRNLHTNLHNLLAWLVRVTTKTRPSSNLLKDRRSLEKAIFLILLSPTDGAHSSRDESLRKKKNSSGKESHSLFNRRTVSLVQMNVFH